MGRYGRDYGAGRFGEGGAGRYDGFRYGPREGWSGPPGWGPYSRGPGRERGRGGGYGEQGSRGAPAGRGRPAGGQWGGESAADRVRAADIMTANPEAVTPDASLQEIAGKMRELDVGIIPVVDDVDAFRLRGVITDRDIAVRAAAEGEDMKKARASDFMSSDVQTVHENDHVRDVFAVMKRARVRRVPVVDDEGKLLGIVAQADLAVNYAGLDLQRETEVEEVIERISEPARPRWNGRDRGPSRRRYVVGGPVYDDDFGGEDLGERIREGWDRLRREARHLVERGYERGYDRGWWR